MKRVLATAATLLFAAAFTTACSNNNDDNGVISGPTTTAANSVDSSTTTSSGAGVVGSTINITASNFKFDPTTITATAGQPVTFTIKNTASGTEHNLTIEKLSVNKDVKAGESASQTVTPAAGTYDYHCEYHPTQMKGTLTVK